MSRHMPKRADLPGTLPLFPLAGALLLPRAQVPLHVFEPRYVAMIDDCLKTPHRLIGVIQPRPAPRNEKADGASPRLHSIGCAGRLTGFSETDDGRYLISLTGICRFRLDGLAEADTPYLQGTVDWSGFEADLGRSELDPRFDREGFLFLLGRYFARHRLSTDWEDLGEDDDELLINSMAMLAPLDPAEKQALLEAPRLADRRETLMALMEFALLSEHVGEERRQ